MIWTLERKDNLGIPLEETHISVTINQTTDNQHNYEAKGTKIPMAHDQ